MAENSHLAEIIAGATPIIQSVVDVFIKPKLQSFKNSRGPKSPPTESNFLEYYERTFKKLVVVNTLALSNSQKILTDIYVPLTLIKNEEHQTTRVISGYPKDISDTHHNILITDTAGMGKSTMMKIMFLDCLNQNVGIPIFIELRRLKNEKSLLDEIYEQLSPIQNEFNKELLIEIISEGGFIFFLDGYDEIANEDQEEVTRDIQDFISKANKNRFFITSRPENTLSSFGNFYNFTIKKLKRVEAFQLLKKYDNNKQRAEQLIKVIETNNLDSISDFLENPLLVTLLYTAFDHRQKLPFKKHLFYRQVYDANFENHDLSKGESFTHKKYSKLDIDDFHRILRHIGFSCMKLQTIEFPKDKLLELITQSRNYHSHISFSSSEFLKDLIKTVPLFLKDGNYYRWAHKSLQEYFAAQFIYLDTEDSRKDILNQIYESEHILKYINIIDLYCDMDPRGFSSVFEKTMMENLFAHVDKCFKAFEHIDNHELIYERAILTFQKIYLLGYNSIEKNLEESQYIKALSGRNVNFLMKHMIKIHDVRHNGTVSMIAHPEFTFMYYSEPKNSIQEILFRRGKRYFHSRKSKSDVSFLYEIINVDMQILPINLEHDNISNSLIYFERINNVLHSFRQDDFYIDYHLIKKEYNNLIKEKSSNSIANLSDGI